MHLTPKQTKALDLLEHPNGISEVLFGGGAGGGKSQLGTYWVAKSALKYPGTRWLLGREEIKTLKETTLVSFFDVVRRQGALGEFTYRENRDEIRVRNGSTILLKGIPFIPSDRDYDYLGSLELTGGFIDEIPQITQKGWQVAKSRIRYKLDEYGLAPKLLGSCNPSKTWVYSYFYKPQREGLLEPHKAFVQSLLTDNPHITQHYLDNLMTLDPVSRERLLLGNWEYDGGADALMPFDSICDVFRNAHVVPSPGERRYLSADIARFGADNTVLVVWEGWRVLRLVVLSKKSTADVAAEIRKLCTEYRVPMSQVIVDEDGVGGGVRDQMPGSKGFVNNARPLPDPKAKTADERKKAENYENLKTQCYYRFADRVKRAEVYAPGLPAEVQQALTEELEQVKRKDMDKEGKLRIQPKEVMKLALGRSPDYADALMMREYFELSATGSAPVFGFTS